MKIERSLKETAQALINLIDSPILPDPGNCERPPSEYQVILRANKSHLDFSQTIPMQLM